MNKVVAGGGGCDWVLFVYVLVGVSGDVRPTLVFVLGRWQVIYTFMECT